MSINSFVCPICGNNDIHSIGYLNGKPYCRRCISFRGEEVEHKPSYPKKAPIHLEYELSPEQLELSDRLVENYKKGIDSLVFAVTGSGKTEITLGIIKYVVEKGEKVAFAIPRKDVCTELCNRLRNIFRNNKVIALYGGHNKDKYGDIVVLTTHQLYRYKKYFSLIVLDEIDAFPFKGDPVLYKMFENSLCGHYVMMSATPSKEVIKLFSNPGKDILRLDIRYHRHPLPVPLIKVIPDLFSFFYLIYKVKRYLKENKKVFVFAPTIERCESLYKSVSLFCRGGNYVHSKRKNREEIIRKFREGTYCYLIATSVLERGVTVANLQVIITNSDHFVYDSGTLIQISGRAGRKKEAPEGEVIFIAKRKTNEMVDAINKINESNKVLSNMLQRD